MRRTDPPALVLPDAEGTALPSYPDSDVGSSPRSLSAGHGARPGSLTEEPSPVRWDDSAFARVRLMCSYGGRILPRPHDNQLRYVGGESRIVVVSRSITFSELTVKLCRMFGVSVAIKYQFPNEELDALISVTSDEDLENMMEEYDRLQRIGNRPSASARIRLFLFPAKLERSQTASLLEMMDNNPSRERWFVDILNGLPVLPHVRSESSSIVSESQDYLFQSNMDTLEEWAAAASYGNSSTSALTEENPSYKQGNPVSATALFGSLLQHVGSSEVASDPGSPLPLNHTQFMTGSSASAPPAVISLLSSMVGTASSGLATPTQHVGQASDGSASAYMNKRHVGSADGSVGVPEQRKHVDSEVLLTSDKVVLTSNVAGAEQFLPAGLMDDDAFQTAKGSFDEECGSSQTGAGDARMAEPDKALRGELVSQVPTVMGQPVFDEDVLAMRMLAKNLKNLQLEEELSSPVASPSGKSSSSSAQFSPTAPATTQQQALSAAVTSKASADEKLKQQVPPAPNTQQQPLSTAVMSKVSADEKLKQQAPPVSSRTGAPVGTEDQLMQQNLPSAAPRVMMDVVGDVSLRQQVSPSLAHFVPSSIPQQAAMFPNEVVEGMPAQQIPGVNVTKDVEMPVKPQAPPPVTSGACLAASSPIPPTVLHEPGMRQKSPAVAAHNYIKQVQGFEIPTANTVQAPGAQLPINSQMPLGSAANPLPSIAAPLNAGANVGGATRQATGTSRPQSPHTAMVGGGINPAQHVQQVWATGTPIMAPPIVLVNVSLGEATGLAPVTINTTSPSSVFLSMGEGVKGIPAPSYPQGEAVNVQRHVSDPLPTTHRVVAGSPKLGNQFNAVNFNAQPAPGIPTRFRAVGRPILPVVEGMPVGIPVQQAAAVGATIADKKASPAVQRALTSPSMRVPAGPGGQYSFFLGDQANVSPQSAAIGGTSRYNTPSNVMVGTVSPDMLPFSGANPFVDNFQPVSTYQDVLEVAPADQQQRRQARP